MMRMYSTKFLTQHRDKTPRHQVLYPPKSLHYFNWFARYDEGAATSNKTTPTIDKLNE